MKPDLLIAEHLVNADVIADRYIYTAKNIRKVHPEQYLQDVLQIIKQVKSELATSATNTFHKAIENNIEITLDFVTKIQQIGVDVTSRFSEEINA